MFATLNSVKDKLKHKMKHNKVIVINEIKSLHPLKRRVVE